MWLLLFVFWDVYICKVECCIENNKTPARVFIGKIRSFWMKRFILCLCLNMLFAENWKDCECNKCMCIQSNLPGLYIWKIIKLYVFDKCAVVFIWIVAGEKKEGYEILEFFYKNLYIFSDVCFSPCALRSSIFTKRIPKYQKFLSRGFVSCILVLSLKYPCFVV